MIQIYAYALKGSVDATNWQLLERKQRFLCLAMSGDRSIRRLEDIGESANQFAMAKALASGDERLMKKAGLEAELARLRRLKAAHYDDQFNVRRAIERAERDQRTAETFIPKVRADIAKRQSTRGEAFQLMRKSDVLTERQDAGKWLMGQARTAKRAETKGRWTLGEIGGFELVCETWSSTFMDQTEWDATIAIVAKDRMIGIDFDQDTAPLGFIARIENTLLRFDSELADAQRLLAETERKLPGYRARDGMPFREAALLEEKEEEMASLEADLAEDTARREAEAAEALAAMESLSGNDNGGEGEEEEAAA